MPFGQFNLAKVQTLQKAVQPLALSFLERAESAGVPCEIIQGTRTHAEQQVVFDQGRTTAGPIVTKAKPGDSFHQYGLAFDAVPVAYKNMPDWNPSGPLWLVIGQIGEGLGLQWGGRWRDPDAPHFELNAAPISELKAYWEKFKQVMPIKIEPTIGAFGVIMLIAAAYFFWLRPMLARRGYV